MTPLLIALAVVSAIVTAVYIHQEIYKSTFPILAEAQGQTGDASINNMTTYENQTLGIAFEYPTGWELSDWDFSDEAEEEITIEPRLNNSDPKYDSDSLGDSEIFSADLETDVTIKILDNPEILNPDTLQLEQVSVRDYCDDLRASLSDETLETAGFSDPYTYWLSNQIGRDEITTVANQTACRIDSIALHDDVQERLDIEVYLQKDDKAYQLIFSTDPTNVPNLAPVYQKMIDSFRFL